MPCKEALVACKLLYKCSYILKHLLFTSDSCDVATMYVTFIVICYHNYLNIDICVYTMWISYWWLRSRKFNIIFFECLLCTVILNCVGHACKHVNVYEDAHVHMHPCMYACVCMCVCVCVGVCAYCNDWRDSTTMFTRTIILETNLLEHITHAHI